MYCNMKKNKTSKKTTLGFMSSKIELVYVVVEQSVNIRFIAL